MAWFPPKAEEKASPHFPCGEGAAKKKEGESGPPSW